eukprot:Skav224367  [mRNA]  locus=scaffold4379:21809:25230:- [translate_table: standard]
MAESTQVKDGPFVDKSDLPEEERIAVDERKKHRRLLERREKRSPIERGTEKTKELRLSEESGKAGVQEKRSKGVPVAAGITPTDVAELIEEASLAAAEKMGGSSSQSEFHRTASAILAQGFKEASPEPSLWELGDAIHRILMINNVSQACRPPPKAGTKDIFPLPAPVCDGDISQSDNFLQALVTSLNSLSGQGMTGNSAPTSEAVLKRLRMQLNRSELLTTPLPTINFDEFFRIRGVDYAGEEIKLARRISWEEIRHSLPDQVGMLDIREFCGEGVLHYVDNFHDYLVAEGEMKIGRTPDVMIKDGDWPMVVKGLLQSGVCTVLPQSQLFHINRKPLLSGMFAVSKQEFVGSTEVCRLIMNLKPVNRVCRPLAGDTGTLPAVHTMGALYLKDEELLCISSEDIRCFFYLFRLPLEWHRFMAFGRRIPPELLPHDFPDELGYLCSQVLPMGFVNSVAIAQHIHRRVIRKSMGSFPHGLGGQDELRRDRFFPQGHHLFRVYLDNYDELAKVDGHLADLIQGTPSPVVTHIRQTYSQSGLPRHPKKSTEQQLRAEVQGAWFDGMAGTCSAKPSKVAKYAALALQLVLQGSASLKELQVVGGGLVYVAMFRRPMLSGLNAIWRAIVDRSHLSPSKRVLLPVPVMVELVRFVGLAPLAFLDFRASFDPNVTASDASTTGGGLCVSRGLTPYGRAASLSEVRGDVPEEHDFCQVLSVGLFDGIAALRVGLDLLGLPIAGHISVECNEAANRVVESFFPEVITVSQIEAIDEQLVLHWSTLFSNVGVIIIGAGPPCQGVSRLNCDKKGALRDARSVLFKEVPRVRSLFRKAFPWAQVHDLVENVASMSFEDCQIMCKEFEDYPWYIDAHGISLCHRPRVYWVSWELLPNDGVTFLLGSNGQLPIQGEVQLQATLDSRKYLEAGWDLADGRRLPTFTTSRPTPVPLKRPAGLSTCSPSEVARWKEDDHRFPPYQYRTDNCLWHATKTPRVASIKEREAILGFPVGYTRQCLKKALHDTVAHKDSRLTLLGNTWSVPVITLVEVEDSIGLEVVRFV